MVARMIAATLVLLLAGCGGGGGAGIAETPAPSQGGAPGTVQLKVMSPSALEAAGTVSIAVTRTGGSNGAISVAVATEAGTATAGQDFTATSTTVQFFDGDSTDKIVAIPLLDDALPEGAETFKVSMVSAANPFATPLTVTITDDDPPGTLELSSATYSVGEGGGTIAINVTRTGGSAGPASVTVSTSDGSALAAQDYNATTATVTFAAGDATPKQAMIPILNDAAAEPDETFEVSLTSASGASLGANTTASITIPANDQPPPPPAGGQPGALQLSASAYSVNESSGNLIVTITRIGGANGIVGATLTLSPDTALAGQDYVGTSSTVSFGSGDASSRIVSIPIVNDNVAESAESFSVTLSAPTGGATLGAPFAAVASIRDNDPPASPVPTLTPHTKRLDISWTAVPTALTYQVFLNPDGVSGFTQVGADVVAPATTASIDVSVHTFRWPAALLRVEACNDTACSGSTALSVASAMLPTIGYLKAASVDANDTFGTSVAVSGDGGTVIVGVPGEDSNATGIDGNAANNGTANAGAVYVFGRTAGEWSQQAYLKASNTALNNAFGTAVAISSDGSTIAIGAPGRNATAGAAYVFVRNGASWAQQGAALTASNEQGDDRFGTALALTANGSILAVGAIGEDSNGSAPANNSAPDAGAAYVFVRSGTVWSQQAYIKASNAQEDDHFGVAVAMSATGTTLAIGATGEASASTAINGDQNDNAAGGAGAVYVFTHNGVTWIQSAYIKAPNAEPIDAFGAAVSLSADGNTLAVSAPAEDGTVTGAQQFPIDPPPVPESDPNAPPPSPQPPVLPTTFQQLCQLGLNPTFEDWRPSVGCESGAVYIFVRDAGAWSAHTYIKGSNNEYEDRFGTAIALSADGNAVAIGSPLEDSSALGVEGNETLEDAPGSGAAYVYRRAGDGTWSQQAYVKAANTGAADTLGTSIALSSDAAALVVGATGEASSSDTDQNDNSAAAAGATYLY
jgi:trimeric autotransporter adhesin